MRFRSLGLSRVDPDEGCAVAFPQSFSQVANGGDGGPGAALHDGYFAAIMPSQELLKPLLLQVGPITDPGIVTEHEDIGARRGAAVNTFGDAARPHGDRIHADLFPIGPDVHSAGGEALEVVD